MKKLLFLVILVFMSISVSVYAKDAVDMNAGAFVQDGDWIYYWNQFDNTLCKVKTDGTENSILLEHYNLNYPYKDICFDDKYIYCSNSYIENFEEFGLRKIGIIRIDKETLKTESIYNKQLDHICYINNDRIVFNGHNSIYSIKTDGSELSYLTQENSNCYVGENGLLYYCDYYDKGIYKIDIYGNHTEKISNNTTHYMVVENGWLYYDNRSDDGKMYKMKVDGTENVKMNNDDCYYITINDGWIYYSSGQEGFSLCRINGKTLEKQFIAKECELNVNVVNGYLFYTDSCYMYMVSINGGTPMDVILDKSLFGTDDDLDILINSNKLVVSEGDTPPMIIDNRVMVPARAFSEKLNTEVKWDEESKTAHLVNTKYLDNNAFSVTVTLTLGSNIMKIEKSAAEFTWVDDNSNRVIKISDPWKIKNEEITLDVPIQEINGRIMVPIRAIVEVFEYNVSWRENTKTVHVYGSGEDGVYEFIEEK